MEALKRHVYRTKELVNGHTLATNNDPNTTGGMTSQNLQTTFRFRFNTPINLDGRLVILTIIRWKKCGSVFQKGYVINERSQTY